MKKVKNQPLFWMAIFLLISAVYLFSTLSLVKELSSAKKALSVASKRISTGYLPAMAVSSPNATERNMSIVAVSAQGGGEIGTLTVRLTPGSNNVFINTNPFLETDLQYSINKAVEVAKSGTQYNNDRDFIFFYHAGQADLIGGESAGAATTIAIIAAIENKALRRDTIITGTINEDGTIGPVGGILEKARAVADAGYKNFLVPKGQAKAMYYEKKVTKEKTNFGVVYNAKYTPQSVDLKKVAKDEWGLNIIEVKDVQDALKYFITYNGGSK